MSKIDTSRQPLLRVKIREVLRMVPDRRFTEQMILDAVNQLIPVPATLTELRLAIEWNQAGGFIDYNFNRDYDRDEWFLTKRGKEKA